MKKITTSLLLLSLILIACDGGEPASKPFDPAQEEQAFREALQVHLNAVNEKDLTTLDGTMSEAQGMYLILPQTEPTTTKKAFMDMHEEWFEDTSWTFETKILDTEIAENLGIAIVDVMYKEPERNGKPYFNHMIVSYALKKIEGKWYIIKDHASSIEKTEN
ncbi:MAG: nuclear transport factor 2 family protein [Saprospiraceae bacterium]